MSWSLTITERDFDVLRAQLLRTDGEEHAAFLYAGLAEDATSNRLLVRRVVPVADADFGPTEDGTTYRVASRSSARAARECDDEDLCLLWVHSHPLAGDNVEFSPQDLRTISHGHPALLDLTHGRPVAALVLGQRCIAGEVWTADLLRHELDHVTIVGRGLSRRRASPEVTASMQEERFARQVLLFGRDGQSILHRLRVGVIGAGGGGSLIIQSLAHLGVGHITALDFDIVSDSNLARIVGSEPGDATRHTPKIDVMRRLVSRIDPTIEFEGIDGDVTYRDDARALASCDFIFLATDTMFSRYAFNLLVHQYLVPGIQVGAKVTSDASTGSIGLIHLTDRVDLPDSGCFDCAHLIDYERVRWEQLNPDERRAQRYVDSGEDDEIEDPSIITFNSISTGLATTDFLLMATGLLPRSQALPTLVYYPLDRELRSRQSSARSGCHFCDPTQSGSVFGRGDLRALSLRPGRRPRTSQPTESGQP